MVNTYRKPPKKRPTNQKAKGNRYERKVAKELSEWIFNDGTILYKHEDSGARKVVYTGDITPKHVSKYPWPIFPFVFECKNGYKNQIPSIMNHNHLRKMLRKLLDERSDEQRIPVFIAQYHHQIPIFMTTISLNLVPYSIAIALEYDGGTEFFYVYKYKEVLSQNFNKVMPEWFNEVIKKNDAVETKNKNTIQTPKISEADAQNIVHEVLKETNKETEEIPKDDFDRPLSKKEKNIILGDIIGDILGV